MVAEPPATPTDSPEQGSPPEELRYRLRQQQLTSGFALFALRTHQVQDLLQEACRVCAEGLESRLSKVMEYLPEENQFLVRAGVGWKPGVVGEARTGADPDSPTGYAFQTGQPVISNHLEGETRFRTPELLAAHGIRRAINALIQVRGQRFGIIEADSPLPGRFTEADLTFVEGLGNLLGVALERQAMEEALRQQEALLQQAVKHQEMLAMEIDHRVKNSLALVAGLLDLQGRGTENAELQRALTDARTRVQAISRIHDRLWRKTDVQTVDLAEFLGDVCENLGASFPGHRLVRTIEPIVVSTDQAMSVGLLANELITNAVKYAYPGGSGPVRIGLSRAAPDVARLEVSDNGIGLDPDDEGSSAGLGHKIISTLTQKLGAEAEWQDAQPGTRFILTFRVETPSPPPQQTTDSSDRRLLADGS